jgi:hypothetical protein
VALDEIYAQVPVLLNIGGELRKSNATFILVKVIEVRGKSNATLAVLFFEQISHVIGARFARQRYHPGYPPLRNLVPKL